LVFKYVFAHLGDREDAEDTASQVFLEALRSIDDDPGRERPVLGWLNAIARRLIAQRVRQRLRERREQDVITPLSSSAGMSDAIIEHLDLADALAKLTVDQQDVIVLRFFLLMSIKETAEALGKSEGSVPVLQVRAIAALRRHLAPAALRKIVARGEGRP
jgi:RNA polymerase sigma-70 factor (ECF subfamily)